MKMAMGFLDFFHLVLPENMSIVILIMFSYLISVRQVLVIHI